MPAARENAKLFVSLNESVPKSVRTFEMVKQILKAGPARWKHSGGSE
jgi:hypothetical protein